MVESSEGKAESAQNVLDTGIAKSDIRSNNNSKSVKRGESISNLTRSNIGA